MAQRSTVSTKNRHNETNVACDSRFRLICREKSILADFKKDMGTVHACNKTLAQVVGVGIVQTMSIVDYKNIRITLHYFLRSLNTPPPSFTQRGSIKRNEAVTNNSSGTKSGDVLKVMNQ